MTGHTELVPKPAGPRWDSGWIVRCECGWTNPIPAGDLMRVRAATAHAAHAQVFADARAAEQQAFYVRTGSCGLCGQPGGYCRCVEADPCGCSLAGLHPLGSGLAPDALDQFRVGTVGDEAGLW